MKRAWVLLAVLLVLSLPGLAQSEAQRVAVAEHDRNLRACTTGYGYCDHSLLTSSEVAPVRSAEHDRNLRTCTTGYGYCDHSILTSTEVAPVRSAEHDRNLRACTTGYGYCDHSLLATTPSQAPVETNSGTNSAVSPNTPSPANQSSTSIAPPCAENGSCYGDPNANGVPKTVHVDGYYRKDGTYVRGYYRSAPGTNPPRSHR